jgi:predicted dehydrogenase
LADIKLGLIGAGRWGRNYIRTIQRMEGVRLARLASRNPESAQLAGEGCKISADWLEVAQAADIQGVIIATPPGTHAEIAKAAIDVGNPALIEKPLCLSLTEAVELRSLAKARGTFAMVGHTHLFAPAYQALKELGGALGPLKAIEAEAGNWGPFRKDTPVLWDWGAHDAALCLDLVGLMPVDTSARLVESRETEEGLGETIALHFDFPEGVTADIRLSNLMSAKARRFTARFEAARLVYDDLAPAKLAILPPSEDTPAHAIDVPLTPPLDLVVREFTDSIALGRDDLASLDLGVAVVAVLAECAERLARA